MFLEVVTLGSLAGVLLVKYGTAARLIKLNQRQLELEKLCREHQGRCRTLVNERKAAEGEVRDIQGTLERLETRLEELKAELVEQEGRNQDLQERLLDK